MADNTLNYSSFDFEALKQDMITNMKANGIFKDYNFDGSNINQLIELFAGIGDLLNFYINMVADESFLRTADMYSNINKIVELIGYNPYGPKSSEVTITVSASFNSTKTDNYFTIPNIPTEANQSPTLTATSTSEDGLPIKYTPVSSTTFVAVSGSNTFVSDVKLVQGQYQYPPLKFSGNGQPFQKFLIDDPDAIEEYMIVKVGGLEWTHVSNIYTHGAEKIYSTRYGKDKKIEIQFGNGMFGQMPYAGIENIEVSYIKSMNLKGAIGAGELTKFDYPIYLIDIDTGANEIEITFSITQSDASVGHDVAMNEEQIRNLAPRQFRTQDRLMSSNDHQDLLQSELGNYVSQVLCLNQDDYYELINYEGLNPATSGFGYNNIYMYVLPKYGYEVNESLRSRIMEFLDQHKLISLNYVFRDLDYINVDFLIVYWRDPQTLKQPSQLETDIYNVIKEYFSKTSMTIHGVVKYSVLLKNLMNIDGITSLTMALSADGGYLVNDGGTLSVEASAGGWLHQNVYMNPIQFPVINNSGLSITYSGDEA